MDTLRSYSRCIVIIIFFVTFSFPTSQGSERVKPNVTHPDPEAATKPTIVFSTLFPDFSQDYKIHQALYEEVFRRMGYNFRMIYHPTTRELIELNKGHLDGLAARIYNIDDENQFTNLLFVPEPICSYSGIGVVKDPEIHINGWDSIGEYKVVHLSGEKWVENKVPSYVEEKNIIRASDWMQALRILDTGRADIYIELEMVMPVIRVSDEFRNMGFLNAGKITTITFYPTTGYKKADGAAEPA